jgi:hypothetical protein
MGGRVAGIGARDTARPDVRHAALPARDVCDVSVVACDVPVIACDVSIIAHDVPIIAHDVAVVTIMVVMPPRVVAGVIGASMAPCTVMRSCRSRGDRYGDCRRAQRQRNEMKRPAERNQLNHTQSSVAPPFPWRPRETDAARRLEIWMWQQKDTMRHRGNDFGVIPRKFNDEKRNDAAALQPRTLTAIFRAQPQGDRKRAGCQFAGRERVKNKMREQ